MLQAQQVLLVLRVRPRAELLVQLELQERPVQLALPVQQEQRAQALELPALVQLRA